MQDDKAERAKEREQDMREMKELISMGVKKEVEAAIAPLIDKQQLMETEQESLKKQFSNVLQEMKEMKEKLVQWQNYPPLPSTSSLAPSGSTKFASLSQLVDNPGVETTEKNQAREKLVNVADFARRTVSLSPFAHSDIGVELRRGAQDEDEAKLWAVQAFLRYEMNIKSDVISTLCIDKVFPPAKDNWNTIYVTFSSVTMVNTVYSYARNMRREVHVGIYVPKEWYPRYRALEGIAYEQRHSEIKYKTRVKWGNTDLILYRKGPGNRYWSIMSITTPLPPVDLCAVVLPHHSPAPGRQTRDTTQRSHGSGSVSDSDSALAKNVRTDGEDSPKVLHTSVGDPGKVIAEESYCPSSPAPTKSDPRFPYNSPIFSKKNAASFRMNPMVL